MSAVGRFDDYDARWYVDPSDPDSRYESVTTIISASNNKPWLTAWAAKLAAQYAVDKHDFIGTVIAEAGHAGAVDLIKGAAKRLRETKADMGSYYHDVAEALVLDKPFPMVPEHLVDVEIDGERIDLDAISDGFLNFVADHDPVFHLAEATVASTLHGYAGTLDLVADFPAFRPGHRRALIDIKSGIVLDNSMGAQLAAYRRADQVWLDDMGNKARMVPVDFAAVLHLRPEYSRGYKLLEVAAGDREFEWFMAMTRQFHLGQELGTKLVRRALYPALPDGSQPPPLLEDTDLRCRSSLIAAGVVDVTALAALTAAELKAIKGVGPKALEDIAALLALHATAEKAA